MFSLHKWPSAASPYGLTVQPQRSGTRVIGVYSLVLIELKLWRMDWLRPEVEDITALHVRSAQIVHVDVTQILSAGR